MMNNPSLRELKKEATAHGLAEAAFELALERGMDGFIVEDIVQRAGYSKRTFANYYSCKEEAVVAAVLSLDGNTEIEAYLLELQASLPPLEALYQLMKMQLTVELLRRLRKLVTLSKQYPALEPYILGMFHNLQAEAQNTLWGMFRDSVPRQYCLLLIGAVYGAVLPMIDGSIPVLLPGDPDIGESDIATFEQFLDTTFGYLRNGF